MVKGMRWAGCEGEMEMRWKRRQGDRQGDKRPVEARHHHSSSVAVGTGLVALGWYVIVIVIVMLLLAAPLLKRRIMWDRVCRCFTGVFIRSNALPRPITDHASISIVKLLALLARPTATACSRYTPSLRSSLRSS